MYKFQLIEFKKDYVPYDSVIECCTASSELYHEFVKMQTCEKIATSQFIDRRHLASKCFDVIESCEKILSCLDVKDVNDEFRLRKSR